MVPISLAEAWLAGFLMEVKKSVTFKGRGPSHDPVDDRPKSVRKRT
jgi:hypothetical protein